MPRIVWFAFFHSWCARVPSRMQLKQLLLLLLTHLDLCNNTAYRLTVTYTHTRHIHTSILKQNEMQRMDENSITELAGPA